MYFQISTAQDLLAVIDVAACSDIYGSILRSYTAVLSQFAVNGQRYACTGSIDTAKVFDAGIGIAGDQ